MTRKEEYHCTITTIYVSARDFIKWSKYYYGLSLETLCNAYIMVIDEIIHLAFLDDVIRLDDFKELSMYADNLVCRLKECFE